MKEEELEGRERGESCGGEWRVLERCGVGRLARREVQILGLSPYGAVVGLRSSACGFTSTRVLLLCESRCSSLHALHAFAFFFFFFFSSCGS